MKIKPDDYDDYRVSTGEIVCVALIIVFVFAFVATLVEVVL